MEEIIKHDKQETAHTKEQFRDIVEKYKETLKRQNILGKIP